MSTGNFFVRFFIGVVKVVGMSYMNMLYSVGDSDLPSGTPQ